MMTKLQMPVNWTKFEDNGGMQIGRNYDFDYEKSRMIGLIFSPKVEFAFTRYFGLSASPQLVWNKEFTYYGIGVGYMLGFIRTKNI